MRRRLWCPDEFGGLGLPVISDPLALVILLTGGHPRVKRFGLCSYALRM
jgi:hypothetical protein